MRKPPQLLDVVGRDGVTVATHDPRDGEHVPSVVRLDVDSHELDGLDLEPGLLEELTAKSGDRVLGLAEEATGEVPVAAPRLERAAREQHTAVPLEDALHPGDRVRPVPRAAGRAHEMILRGVQLAAAPGTEAPVVVHTHKEDMMENLEPAEPEQELCT